MGKNWDEFTQSLSELKTIGVKGAWDAFINGSAEAGDQLEKDKSLIDEFKKTLSSDMDDDKIMEQQTDLMQQMSAQARVYVNQMDKAKLSSDAFAASQTRLATAMNALQSVGQKTIAVVGNMLTTLAITAAFNIAFKAITSIIKRQENLRQAALDASTALNEQTSSINNYKEQITSLCDLLEKGNLSEQEAYDTRKQLISIQDELVDKYGSEAAGIDLVNGKLDEQIAKLDGIADRKAKTFLASNSESINTAQKKMTEDLYLQPGGMYEVGEAQAEKLQEIVSKYADQGLTMRMSGAGMLDKTGSRRIEFNITANATDAERTLSDFMNDLAEIEDKTHFLGSEQYEALRNGLSTGVQDAQSAIDTWGSEAETAAKYQIQLSDTWSELYKNLEDAQTEYNDAVAKDNDAAISAAIQKAKAARDALNDSDSFDLYSDKDKYVKQYLDSLADQLEESSKLKAAQIGLNAAIKDGAAVLADYLNITEEDAKSTVDTIKSSVQSLNGLNDLDLVDIGSLENAGTEITAYTKEQVQAYDNMKSAADKLGISMSDLIDILVKAGLVTGESIKYTNEFTTNALSAATNATKAISLVTAAIQSQSTTAGVSSDSYSELIKEQGEYAAALQFENGYMKLNTEAANKITQAKIDEAEANIKLAYSQNQMKYAQVKADLEALNTAVQQNGKLEGENAEQVEKARAELEAQSKQLRENCRNLQMQYSLLIKNSGAYQDWVNAQNATESGDMYDSIINAKKAIAEGLKNGKIGTEKFKAAVELTIPEDYQDDIAKYMKRLNRYFKQASDGSADASGLNNFLKDSIKAGLMSKDAKDQITIAANKTTKDFADALHLSMEDVQSIWGELQEYGWEFDWGSLLGNPVDNLRMQIDDIQDQMDALGEDAEGNPVWQALNEQLTDLQEKLKETFTGMDSGEINQTIDEIIEEAKKANGQLTDSQADALYEMGRVQNMYDLKEAQDKLTEAQKEYNDAVQSGTDYSAMEGVATELQNAQDQVTKLTQAKEKLGEPTPVEIQTFAVKYAAGEIDGIQHDAKETTEMLANIGCSVDTTQAQSEIETQNQMADEFRNKFDNVPVTLDTSTCETKISTVSKALDGLKKDIPVTLTFGIKGTLITGVANGLSYSRGGGSSKTKGTGHAAGTQNAPGGKTLVGEIGNELVVNPHTGKWYTVGDNGAEFVNLPHGAIVFNHEKTQRLLKNGFVGSYGDALVSGNAMDAGSPGVGSFVGTAGNNYMPGKNPLVNSTYKATKASTKATTENTKALEQNKKALEKQKTALEKQKTALEKESNKLKIYGQAAIDEIEKREKALNKEKEAQDKVFEAQIEALNKKKMALQKANDEEDRAIKLAELKDALEKAKANRTVRIYNKNQGFIWAADQEAVNEAQTNLDEQQRDWRNEDILQAVDDEIDKINELKDAYDKSIEAQIEDLDNMKEKWNEVISLIGTSWEDYQLGLAAAAHFNDMTLDGMAGDLVGYKDDVLANMKEIGGVTDQIDSITESIEKLEEAISNAKDAANGSGSGTTDPSSVFGSLDGNDPSTGDPDDAVSTDAIQVKIDQLKDLRGQIEATAGSTSELKNEERELTDSIAEATTSYEKHLIAIDRDDVREKFAAGEQELIDLTNKYTRAVLEQDGVSQASKDAQIASLTHLLTHYTGTYDTIKTTLFDYGEAVAENTDLTAEQFLHSMDTLRGLGEQAGSTAEDMTELLYMNMDAVAENTQVTNEQRQSQIDSIISVATQYGISNDDIIAHLVDLAAQELIASDTTAETHNAMMATVSSACQSMGASYDSLAAKIRAVADAQKMLAGIGNADFNVTMPMGTATNHKDKIQWGKPNFNPLYHAAGVLNAATTHIAITDEKGPEIKMRKPSAGNYSLIEKGTTVIPADASASIWKFGLDPESFIAAHMPQRSIKSVEITQPNVGSGVTVSVGDIQMYGVNDVESFGRVIHERVSGIFAQEFSKR